MRRIPALLLPLLLIGCAAPTTAPLVPESLAGTTWAATGLKRNEMGRETMPRLTFVSTGEVSGTGGCNAFRGKASITADTARFGPLASTRRMCPEGTMRGEDRFFKALDGTRSARIENDQLVLIDASGAVLLRLTRAS